VFTVQQRRWLVPLLIGTTVLVIDQASKIWIRARLGPQPLREAIPLIGDWSNLIYSRNTGVAFGLFQNMSPLFLVLAILICLGAIYVYIVYLPNQHLGVQLSMGLIIGGALGNVVDRIHLGYVVDFIQIGWWPVFNVADSAITVGATILAVYLLFTTEEPPPGPDPQDTALLDELLERDVTPAEHDAPGTAQEPHRPAGRMGDDALG
jgi:signal peptidase II